MMAWRQRAFVAVTPLVTAFATLVIAEALTRWLDGYQLLNPALVRLAPAPSTANDDVSDYVAHLVGTAEEMDELVAAARKDIYARSHRHRRGRTRK